MRDIFFLDLNFEQVRNVHVPLLLILFLVLNHPLTEFTNQFQLSNVVVKLVARFIVSF